MPSEETLKKVSLNCFNNQLKVIICIFLKFLSVKLIKYIVNCFNSILKVIICVFLKQWLLAGEFSEFEYLLARNSPFSEMCETCQTRRHSPSHVARTRQTRRHSPTIYRVLADIRQAVLRGLARLAKGESGEFYANLACLANLASAG